MAKVRLFLFLTLWWYLSTNLVFGQSPEKDAVVLPVEIMSAIDLRPHSLQWRTSREASSFQNALQAWMQGEFYDPALQSLVRSMTEDSIWYRISIVNPTAIAHKLHLGLGANFLVFSQAVIERDGESEVVFTESNRQPFSERAVETARLVSRAFEISPNSEAVVWIGISVDGSSDIGLSLMTPDDLAASYLALTNLQTAFYVSVIFIALFMLGFLFVYFSWAQFFYLAFFLILAAYNAQLSGLMFQWVWPNSPWWNGYASHYIGLTGIMCAAWAAWLFVSASSRHPVFRIASLTFQGVGILAMLAPFFLPLVTVKALLGPVVLIFFVVQFWAAIIALRFKVDGGYIVAAASVVLVLYLGVFTIGSQFEGLIPAFWIAVVLHFGPVLDGVLRFSSTVLQSYRLKQQQIEGLNRLEYVQSTFADVRHDMRQPLGAMRMSLEGVEDGADTNKMKEKLSTLKEGLDYLEGVIEQAKPPSKGELNPVTEDDVAEVAPANLYLNCMQRMFAEEASSKGIELRIVPSSVLVIAPAYSLIRIMSNLVHNSILHSQGDKIVIGTRHIGRANVTFQILDNGIGYQLPSLPDGQRAKERTKHGNGLHIVLELAQANGIRLEQYSRPRQITSTTLAVEKASDDKGLP